MITESGSDIRIAPKDALLTPEALATIDRHARSVLQLSILDQFPYYPSVSDKRSTVARLNCVDQSLMLQTKLNDDPATSDLDVTIIPFEAEKAVYTPSQKKRYPYAHTALFLRNKDQALGLLDPSFGIFTPILPGEKTWGRNWDLEVVENDGEFRLTGSNPKRQFSMSFYPDRPFQTTEDLITHTNIFSGMMLEGLGSYTFVQSPKNAVKMASLYVNRNRISYHFGPDDPLTRVELGNLQDRRDVLETFCEAVNNEKAGDGLSLDKEEFIHSVENFIDLARSTPPPIDLEL